MGATSTRVLTIQSGSIFTVDVLNLMAVLRSASIKATVETVESKAIMDTTAYPVPTVSRWSMSAQVCCDTGTDAKTLMAKCISRTPVAFTATLGSAQYTGGVGILTSVTHTVGDDLTFDIEMEGQGLLTEA